MSKEKVIKIIHGYGSSGVGGVIKRTLQISFRKSVAKNEISAYRPGEAIFCMMGFEDAIRMYKRLIQADSDYGEGNDGITYIIF